MKWAILGILAAGWAAAQVTPYGLKVELGPGLVAVTFSVQGNQVRAYLPDDVAPGEHFSGALEGQPNYVLEFAGQRARVLERAFQWVMPGVQPGEFVPLILRDFRGKELGRASIPVAVPRPAVTAFRFPKFVPAGNPAPVLGPFDGNAETSSFVIGGQTAEVLAESPRKLVVRAPEHLLGPVPFKLQKGPLERAGSLRSLGITTGTPNDATLEVAVTGLSGLNDEVAIKVDTDYIFIRPADVKPDGGFKTEYALLGIESNVSQMEARLVFPQTAREEVALILRTPRKDRRANAAEEHAALLKGLGYDAFPVLEDLLTDYDLGSDAAYAMLATDEERALSTLFATMPMSGANIQRIGFVWFVSHFSPARKTAIVEQAHAAATRVLQFQASGSEAVELALHTMGLSGSPADLPLLEQHYQYRSGWSGVRRIQDASEAAMARLGSPPHLENIRAELAAPLPAQPTPDQAMRIGQVLQKAGFAGRAELVSAVCPHLSDPAVTDIDVTWDPKPSAMAALNAIVNQITPMTERASKPIDEWKAYCNASR